MVPRLQKPAAMVCLAGDPDLESLVRCLGLNAAFGVVQMSLSSRDCMVLFFSLISSLSEVECGVTLVPEWKRAPTKAIIRAALAADGRIP